MADVLPEKVAVTAYTALTLCFPLLSVDMLKVALPLPSRVPVPRVVPASKPPLSSESLIFALLSCAAIRKLQFHEAVWQFTNT
jgi:hypothetical protein